MGKTKKYKDHLINRLKDESEAEAYLNACLEDEDPRVFLLAVKDVAEARGGIGKLSKETALNRQTLYRTLSKSGNPRLVNIRSILASFGFKIHIQRKAI